MRTKFFTLIFMLSGFLVSAQTPDVLYNFEGNLSDDSENARNLTANADVEAYSDEAVTGSQAFDFSAEGTTFLLLSHQNYLKTEFSSKTVAFYIKPDADSLAASIPQLIFEEGGGKGMAIYLENDSLKAIINDASTPSTIGTDFPTDGKYHHVAVTFGSSMLSLYLDGMLINDSSTVFSAVTPHSDEGGMGGQVGGANTANLSGTDYYYGLMDDFRIYTTALTAIEVEALVSVSLTPTDIAETFEAGNPGEDLADLKVQKTSDGNDIVSYLKFDISTLSANVGTAELTIYGSQADEGTGNVVDPYFMAFFGCDSLNWDNSLNWAGAQDFTLTNVPLAVLNNDFSNDKALNPTGDKYHYISTSHLAAYINDKVAAGETEIAIAVKSLTEVDTLNVWLGGTWRAPELKITYGAPEMMTDAVLDAHFNFEGNLSDETANARNLTSDSEAYSDDAVIGSQSFDFGSAGDVSLYMAHAGYLLTEFSSKSVAFFCKTSNSTDGQILFEEGGGKGFTIYLENDSLKAIINDASTPSMVSGLYPTDGEYHHVAFIYENSYIALFLDGQKIDENGTIFSSVTAHADGGGIGGLCGGALTASADIDPSTSFFNGLVDDFRIYTAALSADSIESLIPVIVDVTGVSLDQTSITLNEGESVTLVATIEPADATDQMVTWSSDNEGVATVDQTGMVTYVGPGTATITVTTNDGGFTDECIVDAVTDIFNATINKVVIYPNPVKDRLYISLSAKQPFQSVIEIKDVTGRTIISKDVAIEMNDNTVSIDVRQLNKGTYFISGNGISTLKFMVIE